MKTGKAGQGDHRKQQGLETTNESWGSLLQGCVPAQGSGLTVLRGSQEKLQIWSFVRNLFEGQTKLTRGWTWQAAHRAPDSTLRHENTSPETVSLIRGKAGTQMGWKVQIHSVSGYTSGSTCQHCPESMSLNHIPAEPQNNLWKTAAFPACPANNPHVPRYTATPL